MRARRSHLGLYSTGLPGPSVWRSVQRMGWIGVKSRFLNSSLGEPIVFFPIKNQEVGAPNKSQELLNSPARAMESPLSR